ncbi:hypothetical protein [Microcoleus sp. D2_18a_D3]|uniref:hypothetical protein n=1 Tax=Microcoleus sp. D2_18a_D3 TaxID=3055330 RepID=UPI002FD6DD2B
MKIARIICWQLESTLRLTMHSGIDMSRALAKLAEDDRSATKRLFSVYPITAKGCHIAIAIFPVPNSWSIAI